MLLIPRLPIQNVSAQRQISTVSCHCLNTSFVWIIAAGGEGGCVSDLPKDSLKSNLSKEFCKTSKVQRQHPTKTLFHHISRFNNCWLILFASLASKAAILQPLRLECWVRCLPLRTQLVSEWIFSSAVVELQLVGPLSALCLCVATLFQNKSFFKRHKCCRLSVSAFFCLIGAREHGKCLECQAGDLLSSAALLGY